MKPLLKWVGGKTQLASQIIPYLGESAIVREMRDLHLAARS